MTFNVKYKGYNDFDGMVFTKPDGNEVHINDGEMNLTVDEWYDITAKEYDLGNYGDAIVVTDYEIR